MAIFWRVIVTSYQLILISTILNRLKSYILIFNRLVKHKAVIISDQIPFILHHQTLMCQVMVSWYLSNLKCVSLRSTIQYHFRTLQVFSRVTVVDKYLLSFCYIITLISIHNNSDQYFCKTTWSDCQFYSELLENLFE